VETEDCKVTLAYVNPLALDLVIEQCIHVIRPFMRSNRFDFVI